MPASMPPSVRLFERVMNDAPSLAKRSAISPARASRFKGEKPARNASPASRFPLASAARTRLGVSVFPG